MATRQTADDSAPEQRFADWHLSADGHRWLANALAPAIDRLLPR